MPKTLAAIIANCLLCASAADGQTNAPLPRLMTVEGLQMRVWTAGLEQRQPGQPVIVLEAGSDATVESWKPNFSDLAQLAPVVAYDRRGLGQSAPDTVPPTLKRNVETLHAVLQQLGASPPYVLVGHSLGGVIIRGFSSLYSKETAGLVYLDVPDFEATREERAAALPPEDRKRALEPPDLPAIPADTPPGLRAVFEQLLAEMRDDFPSARGWRQPPGIPVAVVVTTRADRMRGNSGVMVGLQIKHQQEWALSSPNSLFVLAGHTGHQVHRDDPALVLQLVKHVLQRAASVK